MSSALAMYFRKIADKFYIEGNEIMVVSRKATNPSYIYKVGRYFQIIAFYGIDFAL